MRRLSVIWTFDRKAESRLAALPGALAAPPIHPHITLGNYLWEEEPLARYLKELAPRFSAFTVRLAEITLLAPEILVCLPEAPELERYHRLFHEQHDAYADVFTSLKEGNYRPHITLAYDQDGISQDRLDQARGAFLPGEARVGTLMLSREEEDGGFTILAEHTLEK
ncbi:MAG: 2'-5' RNA ligase family protein [Eubacteriales bacterium]|nr:2'-5' RNA ligase family protein [Eubacteriales bacterium]